MLMRLVVLFLFTLMSTAYAEDQPSEMLLDADIISYSDQESRITADGHVRLLYEDHLLYADRLSYYQSEDRIVAEGHVFLFHSNGDLFVADRVDMADHMTRGVVEHLRARLHDNLLIAANNAERIDEKHLRLNQMAYSPCPVCRDSSTPPFWQIKAQQAIRDDVKQEMSYEHAWFEVLGVPVFYTPYLFHPTPDAKRKSGFLTPTISHSKTFGTSYQIPFYWNIAPHMDATIRPTFYGNENPHFQGEFRHSTPYGQYTLSGSGLFPKSDNIGSDRHHFRGQTNSEGTFYFGENWETGFRVNRSTDNTYLRKYKLGDDPFLTSKLYGHYLNGNNYSLVDGLSFQGLDQSQSQNIPLILPWWRNHLEKDSPWVRGSRFIFDQDVLVLSRKYSSETRRVSLKTSWDVPWISPIGHVWNFRPSLRVDGYHVYDVPDRTFPNDRDRDFSGQVGRFIPEMSIDWRYPLARRFTSSTMIVEPVVNLQISKEDNNSLKIPNEDSQSNELSDTNLFSSKRTYGLDLVEEGSRVSYGVYTSYELDNGVNANMLIGQHYRSKDQTGLTHLTSDDHHFSDYVGRLSLKPIESVRLLYHFRMDAESLDSMRDDVLFEYNRSPIFVRTHYMSLINPQNLSQPKRQELNIDTTFDVTKHWTFGLHGVKDLSSHIDRENRMISGGWSARYKGDCVDVLLTFERSFTQVGDVKPDSRFYVQLFLKTLN